MDVSIDVFMTFILLQPFHAISKSSWKPDDAIHRPTDSDFLGFQKKISEIKECKLNLSFYLSYFCFLKRLKTNVEGIALSRSAIAPIFLGSRTNNMNH